MAVINIYLSFDGNCEEAFLFYKAIFGGDFSYIGRFKDMPQDDSCSVKSEMAEKIMHVSLPISKETTLMGSDIDKEWAPAFIQGNNFSIMISADSKEKADRFFTGLVNGGTVTMPMDMAFWGDYFGMLTDKFGINWMISYDATKK